MTTAWIRRTLAGVAAGGVLAGAAGCVSCRHKAFAESLMAGEAGSVSVLARQRVYLFMMNGDDVLELGGMLTLRDNLCTAGFPKVYYAQKEDCAWFHRELRRLERDEPDARYVLLGYGSAADRVTRLAADAVHDRLPLDAVVYLDPAGATADLVATLPLPTLTIRSHNWADAEHLVTTDTVGVASGHTGAPRHPGTAIAVAQVMTAAATRVVVPSIDGLPHLPLRNKLDPTPRGIDPATTGPAPPGWDYLRPAPPFLDKLKPPAPAAPPPPAGAPLPTPREVPK